MVPLDINHADGGTWMTISDDGIGCKSGILESSNSMGLFGIKDEERHYYHVYQAGTNFCNHHPADYPRG